MEGCLPAWCGACDVLIQCESVQEPGIFSSADAVYVLAISVIMLNTDSHNPAVRAVTLHGVISLMYK